MENGIDNVLMTSLVEMSEKSYRKPSRNSMEDCLHVLCERSKNKPVVMSCVNEKMLRKPHDNDNNHLQM